MNISIILNVIFISLFTGFMFSNNAGVIDFLVINASLQIALFIVVACIPYLRTKRISYVDIAWPFGVALIGAQILLMQDGEMIRNAIVGAIYLFIGLRMGIAAVIMGKKTGVIFKHEFPRYKYRRLLVEKSGTKQVDTHLLSEIMAQCFANATVLALPGLLIASNASHTISTFEWLGLGLWVLAYTLESIADAQKMRFISQSEMGVCDIGLWKYSRHPNYFSEWLVWTSIVIAAVPAWFYLASTEQSLVWVLLGIGTLCASIMMYITLVYITGARPAEYYSAQKREGYKAYQASTSMFFLWFPKKSSSTKTLSEHIT